MFWHFPHKYYETRPVSAIRAGNWKLLEYLEDGNIELYNLADDIGEAQNLVDTESLKAEELLSKLHKWKTDVGAKKLRHNPDYKKR